MNLDDFDMAIDTAGSYEGKFPNPGKGCFAVGIHGAYEFSLILVSSRYTAAVDVAQAAELATEWFVENGGDDVLWQSMGNPFYHVEVWPANEPDDRNKIRGIVRLDDDCGQDWEFTLTT